MSALAGRRVALLEARLETELAALFRRQGAEPLCVPGVREVARECQQEVALALDALAEGRGVCVCSSGVAVESFFASAATLERAHDLRATLQRSVVVARGPKPLAALGREGISGALRVEAPFTTSELISSLVQVELEGRPVVLLHYGERNARLTEHLRVRGAQLYEVLSYEWQPPEDERGLERLVETLIAGGADAVVFTSQIQARHLYAAARRMDRHEALGDALSGRVVVGAMGPTCASGLRALGVSPAVVPSNPKMGPLVSALAEHFATREVPHGS